MEGLFDAIRNASTARSWSRGIELARAGAVLGISHSAREIACRVKLPARVAAANVTLYPEDCEWDCTCGSRIDPCECVIAASIALKRANEAGEELPKSQGSLAHLVYRFTRGKESTGLERYVSQGQGPPTLLTTSVAAAGSSAQGLAPTQVDLTIDRLLIASRRSSLQADLLHAILELLGDAPHVELDGLAVEVATMPLAPVGYLEDVPSGYRMVLEPGAEITEVVAPGIALVGGKLFRLSHTDVTGQRLELLPHERRYSHADAAELVTEILPSLIKRFKIEIRSKKLPTLSRTERPRIVMDVQQDQHKLSVLPLLVYGDPPCARIDAGKLVHLGGEVPVRDEGAERALAHRLKEQLDLTLGKRLSFEGDQAARFALKLQRWSGELRGDAPKQFVKQHELRPELSVNAATFQLRFLTEDGEGGEASAESVIGAWQTGASMVPLLAGGWAPLPSAWLDQHGHRVAELLAARDEKSGEVAHHAKLALAQLCQDNDQPLPDALQGLQRLLDDFKQLPPATLPQDLRATLRDYQREGINWLCFLRDNGFGALLADDMGLGKTLQALAALRGPALVVCPRSVVYNWVDEIRKFRPELSFFVYHGPQRKLTSTVDVVLTTYAILRLDKDLLGAQPFATVILDEAQNIKNPDSQVAKAAYHLQADFKLALSGTPVENRLEELWSQFHFTNRGLLGGRTDFNQNFSAPIAQAAPGVASALRQRIRPFLLRRLKRDVATDLPPRTEVVLHCELSESERATYDAVRAATQTEVLEQLAAGGSVLRALEALLRLRQAACHPALLKKKPKRTSPGELEGSGQPASDASDEQSPLEPEEVPADADDGADRPRRATSSKLECLLDALQTAAQEGHKALVFSQWTSLLDLVEPLLEEQGIRFNRLDGSTRDRAGVVTAFQTDDSLSVMLLSLKAGGTGLNLTAADYVFLLDPWWNPAAEDQAADRAHRIGQDKPVVVYRLVARETVEERILELQQRKRELALAALEGGSMAAQLTRDDLLNLLAS